jgi:hypothetical protein
MNGWRYMILAEMALKNLNTFKKVFMTDHGKAMIAASHASRLAFRNSDHGKFATRERERAAIGGVTEPLPTDVI